MIEEEARGMEVCPEYFGEFPIQDETPWGEPIRLEKLWNGLYWLETRDAGWVLAIAYPMGDDLRDETLELAQLTERDRKSGIDNTCGFRFYRYEASCIPLYELLDYRSKKTWEPKINIPALKNAILDFDPDYARKIFDEDLDLLKEFSYTPGAGISFYQFPPAVPE